MQAIITKYLPATNTRSSKVKALCERGSLAVSWDHGMDVGENHRAACDALCARFDAEDVKKYGSKLSPSGGWSRPKASGQIPDGRYVFCFIPERTLERGNSALAKAARAFLEQQTVTNRAALRKILNA